jgi:hypothetical protein
MYKTWVTAEGGGYMCPQVSHVSWTNHRCGGLKQHGRQCFQGRGHAALREALATVVTMPSLTTASAAACTQHCRISSPPLTVSAARCPQ